MSARGGLDDHRDLPIHRFVALDVDGHVAEVAAVAERELKVDQAVRVERLAGLDRDEAIDQARIENLLLDLEVAKVVLRPGVEHQVNVGAPLPSIDEDFSALVFDVDVARRIRRVIQALLRSFVLRMVQHSAGREIDRLEDVAHSGLFAPVAEHADLDVVEHGRLARLHCVAGRPAFACALQRGIDFRRVVAKRLQRLLDFRGCCRVQAIQAVRLQNLRAARPLFGALVLTELRDAEMREDVILDRVVEPDDFDFDDFRFIACRDYSEGEEDQDYWPSGASDTGEGQPSAQGGSCCLDVFPARGRAHDCSSGFGLQGLHPRSEKKRVTAQP